MLRFSLLIGLIVWTCQAETPRRTHENLNSTLWVQRSAEYNVITRQIFLAARAALDTAFDDPNWSAVPQKENYQKLCRAIITDIDETILDNSYAQARAILAGRGIFQIDDWNAWVKEARATPVPGAAEFLQYAASRGVTIFYVTNRDHQLEEATRRNLTDAGFPVRKDIDTVLMLNERPEWTSNKQSRRDYVAASYRVLLLLGDDLNDFIPARGSVAERAALAESTKGNWGVRWFMLPNPVYGGWEDALFDNNRSLKDDERLRIKYDLLKKQP